MTCVEKIFSISISIVSHGQGALVSKLLADLACLSDAVRFEIILTINIPEPLPFSPADFSWPIRVVENTSPKGFAANHNAAFKLATGEWFCVMNPDIRLTKNPFPVLLSEMMRSPAEVIGPAVVTPIGKIEDSVRKFPRPLSLIWKLLGHGDGRYPFSIGDRAFTADWVAGMFMLFSSDAFTRLQGFDERYFMYYEDVDICVRAWNADIKVLACPSVSVIHDARRLNRRNLRHMKWHATSMVRYFWKHMGRLPVVD
ncbi:MAG: glycosyltransferase family 2 protein [Gammaproteobacteria bacterium]|nr:glycosyltransferase family 2 protein [Gammaproteobacteria bacterium]